MKNKHTPTPGPWTAGTVISNETRYTQPIWANGMCIAVVYGGVEHRWTDEHRANVAAITSAPTLLERVKVLEESVKKHIKGQLYLKERVKVLEEALRRIGDMRPENRNAPTIARAALKEKP